ncbi:MAG: phytase [Porticoccaceae bacterium]|nr:phytase [Porticoccaceae bacterium]
MYKLIGLLFLVLFISGCSGIENVPYLTEKRGIAVAEIQALAETTPVPSSDDAADDPAIWVNSNNPELSRVLGTDKQYGLIVYDLEGRQLQALAEGRLNNVDVRQNLLVAGARYDLAVASSRTHNSLDVFLINPDTGVTEFVDRQLLDLTEPYGTCLYKGENDIAYAFVNDTDGRYQQWRLDSLHPLRMTEVREFRVLTQPEGCAADDFTGDLFVGEENAALWRFSALPDAGDSRSLMDRTGAGALVADLEGMDIYRVNEELAYLVTSSQGDFTYAVYEAQGNYRYLGSFRIVDDILAGVDGSEETDGLALSNQYLGENYPKGMLVVQDGFNLNPRQAQNFKYVSWQAIAEALNLQSIE